MQMIEARPLRRMACRLYRLSGIAVCHGGCALHTPLMCGRVLCMARRHVQVLCRWQIGSSMKRRG